MPGPADRRPLSPEIADLLRYGDRFERYAEPWQAVIAVALGFVDSGWSRDAFLTAMFHPQNKCIEALRVTQEKGRHRQRSVTYVRREVERAWSKAVAFAGKFPAAPPGRELLDRLMTERRRADGWHWPVRGGQIHRRVLEAHYMIAERCGRLMHGASVREVAEIAGLGITTVHRAHRFLRREGWLRLERGAARRLREATVWRLTAPQAATITAESLGRQSVPGGRAFLAFIALCGKRRLFRYCTRW